MFNVKPGQSFWAQVHDMKDYLRDLTPGNSFGSYPQNVVTINLSFHRLLKSGSGSR